MAAIYLQHPVHGAKVATMEQEAVYDEGNGWKRFDPSSPVEPTSRETEGASGIAELRTEYEAKFGKRPFMGWDAEKLTEMLAA